jgi:DNA-binding LacI/PurR family transcriptional regulator
VRRRITQREVAELAGVSQATVSVVLNDRTGSSVRIPEATRARVKAALEQAAYVADPAARRLAGMGSRIVGVFTYEAALSPEGMEFYGPLLNGIEVAAERMAWDLLFFTSSPVEGGQRRLFHRKTRLRLTDGCVLLGQQMVGEELERLVVEEFPFVAIGRRDETDALVPYVAVDYVTPAAELIEQAVAKGHRRGIYVHRGRETAVARDRRRAIEEGPLEFLLVEEARLAELPRLRREATVIFTEEASLAQDVAQLGMAGVSLAALGEVRGNRIGGRELTGLHVPRQRLASEALELLELLITTETSRWSGLDRQRFLVAEVEPGGTIEEAR